MSANKRSNICLYTNHLTSEPGLRGIPAPLKYLSKEVRLVRDPWANLGKRWQSLAKLWLCMETVLLKSNHNDLSFTQIRKSTIPEDWKEWMNAKLMNTDARPPDESFGKSFTQYLKGLQLTTPDSGTTVMSMLWCGPGKTGNFGLVLCLYWQAEYSSARKDWEGNVKWVESIFNNILISNM